MQDFCWYLEVCSSVSASMHSASNLPYGKETTEKKERKYTQ